MLPTSGSTKKIRVLVVDDSAFLRRNLPRILETDPEIQVVGTAANGEEGVRLARELQPDVITLDVMMPTMDGLTALKIIMREQPTPVVMVSAGTQEGARDTLTALSLGAVDFISKPSGPISLDIEKVSRTLIQKVKAASSSKLKVLASIEATREKFRDLVDQLSQHTKQRPVTRPLTSEAATRGKRLVAIAASTGGPVALQTILPRLPEDLKAGVIIVQHIATGFTRPLAERLDALSNIRVKEAEDGMPIEPGIALLSPADRHLQVERHNGELRVKLSLEPVEAVYRPSANVLFKSIAAICAPETCAVILTGMGDDGAAGMKQIQEAGGYTVAQDEATSLIYGMPRRAVELGGVTISRALEKIAAEIVKVCV
jgi:two-component system, chemotaxis family, protein-glutamate methylesterase/glutaminase